jgi:uncharacterized membrane protein YeaQ/YmgE (transglycosylase-associated protein family)
MNTVWFLITTIIGGAILGGIAQLLIPGRATIPAWATVLAGVIGMFVGSLVYYKIFGVQKGFNGNWENTTRGIDWWRHVWQVGAAVIAVGATSTVLGMARRS